MASVCISNCVNDARVPVRASYVNIYKWPESDAEFVRSNGRNGNNDSNSLHALYGHPRVVDSISCRQIYLRSYKFSRKESVPEKTQKCFGKVKEKVGSNSSHGGRNKRRSRSSRRRKCMVFRKIKEISCAALFRIFHRFLSCAASVDVVDEKD
ncbi:hypothetical protein Lal_00032277 [Lupinus albus]|uniref:Uncharacterized protein n=1 Tax=Lupinus albus TaxID=3870 RepID=A0A6A4R166_LUPAL|nr:hypothetical protein Lalb_Chr02g0153371 [Lupinus albus]KAF1878205.1 hypothetical protein Lal_00032277 [Lupinus albus]